MVFPGTGESQFVTNFERKNIKNRSESFRPKYQKKGLRNKKLKRIQNNGQEPEDFHTSEEDQGC